MSKSDQASTEQIVDLGQRYLINNYGRHPFVASRGEGSFLFDQEGRRYLDLFAGFGAAGIGGHCHPYITEKVQEQLQTLTVHGNLFYSEPQIRLAQKLIEHSMPGKVFFCNSGAEANEAAMKLVRRAAGPGRYKIISFHNCFHGRTLGALSITPPSFQESFEPMLEGGIFLPWGDLELVASVMDLQTAGVFIEPLQGEGGVNTPDQDFVRGLAELCSSKGILLVCDEVWTAPARTGKWFAYQHYGITPDLVTLGKAVGGGLPLAGMIVNERWADILAPGTHGCTLGGNPLCTAAGLAAMKLIEREGLVERALQLESLARSALVELGLELRGKGAMLGLQLPEKVNLSAVIAHSRSEGLLVGSAKQNVLRIAPPLTIPFELWQEGLDKLVEILKAELRK